MNTAVAVIGAGGHARVVIGTLQAAGYTVGGVFDDDPTKWGTEILGVPIIGAVQEITRTGLAQAVIAIGDNAVRQKLARQLNDLRWVSMVHPHAWVHPSVEIGAGSVIFAGAVVQPEAKIGEHVIINTGATVDHECIVADFSHIAPGAHLAGRVVIEEGVFVGMGSSVIQGCRVGAWSIIGAGAVVVRDLPAHVTAVGLPARVIREHNTRQEERYG
ncbi:MAG: transferase [Armatimonadota bacterium]